MLPKYRMLRKSTYMIFWSPATILIQRAIRLDITPGCLKVSADWVKPRGPTKSENASLVEHTLCDYPYEQDVFLPGLVFLMHCSTLKTYHARYDPFIILFFFQDIDGRSRHLFTIFLSNALSSWPVQVLSFVLNTLEALLVVYYMQFLSLCVAQSINSDRLYR